MKKLTLTIAIGLMIVSANAQNIGFSITRGMTAAHPNFESITSSFNQGMSFGVYAVKPLKTNLSLVSGIQYERLYTGGSVKAKNGTYSAIPTTFSFVQIPVSIERDFYWINMRSRRAAFFRMGAGASINYVQEGATQNIVRGRGSSNSSAINYGVNTSLQWVKPVTWHSEFAFGLTAKCNGTGDEHAPYASFLGIKIDYRYTK